MKIVKVSYKTSGAFASQNQKNIENVMAELQALGSPGINYNACLSDDGQTFIHTAFFKTEEDEKLLNTLISFKRFQEELKLSGPETPPKQALLTLVGSSVTIFNI